VATALVAVLLKCGGFDLGIHRRTVCGWGRGFWAQSARRRVTPLERCHQTISICP